MGDFTVLLGELARTCQELEQIKAQQTKDHDKVSKSFEKTLLSILKQEQFILNHVEEEHRRLRDQLSSIQKDNELALQNGVCEINSMVHKICSVSSQLKQALVTSSNNKLIMRQIQGTLSDIFSKKKSINISLKKVHFTPRPLQTATLGEIRCEEQTLGLSIPCLSKGAESHWCKKARNDPVLLSDETPPWDDVGHHPEGCIGGRMEDDSDHESVSTITNQSSVDLKKKYDGPRQSLSSRDPAVMEADSAALSPRVATKIWITGSRNTAQKLNNKLQGTRTTMGNGDLVKKTFTQHVTSKGTRGNPRKEAFQQLQSSTKCQPHSPGSGMKTESMTKLETDILSNLQECKDESEIPAKTMSQNDDFSMALPEQDTLFRATAAYVCEDGSDSSEDTMEDMEIEGVRDPKACRQLAIRDSRVPSAKVQSDGEPVTRWNSMDSESQPNELGENSVVSYLNKQNLENRTNQLMHHTTTSDIDYMRMSYETSDCLSGDFLNVPVRSSSPSESVKSSYTFIIESPKKTQTDVKSHTFSRSSNPVNRDARKRPPVISPPVEKSEIKSKPQTRTLSDGKQRPGTKMRNQRQQGNWKPVPRSSSMPYIERLSRPHTAPTRRPMSAKERRDSMSSSSSNWSNPRSVAASTPSSALREIRVRVKTSQYSRKTPKTSQQRPRCLSRSEPDLTDCPTDSVGDGITKLVRQFGKFGSGRAELNLPHGISVTSTGSIYIVDYGNRRLQVMDTRGKLLQQFALEAKNYFDVAVSNRGLVALTNSSDRSVDVYSKHGRLLQVLSRNWGAPRGITANFRDEFIVADMKLGAICVLTLDPSTGRQKEGIVLPGFNKPYLVASNSQGLLAVSERGLDGGCCVKVLGGDWQLLKVLGLKSSPGPALCNPWGVCVDSEGGVLVADWAQKHRVIYYPPRRAAQVIVEEGLSSPRGMAVWQDGIVLVADSMHNCMKLYQYQEPEA